MGLQTPPLVVTFVTKKGLFFEGLKTAKRLHEDFMMIE